MILNKRAASPACLRDLLRIERVRRPLFAFFLADPECAGNLTAAENKDSLGVPAATRRCKAHFSLRGSDPPKTTG